MKKRWIAVISTLLLLILVVPSFAGNSEAPRGQMGQGQCFTDEASREEFRAAMQERKQERINQLVEEGKLTKEEGDTLRERLQECQNSGGNSETCQEVRLMMQKAMGGQGGQGGKGGKGIHKHLRDGSCLNN